VGQCVAERAPWGLNRAASLPGPFAEKPAFHRFDRTGSGKISFMLELLLLVLLVVLLVGAIGPRYYRGRGRRRVVREYDTF
jgi:hypothetical protein